MSQYTYTGTLTDIGLGVLTGKNPVMRVRPEVESFGPSGLVSASPVPVTLNASTGAFSMSLVPSIELKPATGGPAGVKYIIEVGRFENALDGTYFAGIDVWGFTALIGGGPIRTMPDAPMTRIWYERTRPPVDVAGIYWVHPVTGDVREWSA